MIVDIIFFFLKKYFVFYHIEENIAQFQVLRNDTFMVIGNVSFLN